MHRVAVALVFVAVVVIMTAGVQEAHATNESSYKYGYSLGISEYSQCTNSDPDLYDACTSPPTHVDTPGSNCGTGGMVTNTTACVDGYVNGFKHWCETDRGNCVKMIVKDTFPGSLLTDKIHQYPSQ